MARFRDRVYLLYVCLELSQPLYTTHTHTLHNSTIDFLDVTIYKGPSFNSTNLFDTKVFFKPTDTHALLFKNSFHPKHTFQGIVKSQLIRFDRICSRREDFRDAVSILFWALKPRGYTRSFLRDCLSTFHLRKARVNTDPIPLITTYTSMSSSLGTLCKSNFISTLSYHPSFRDQRVISAYRRNPNLGDILILARLPSLLDRNDPLVHNTTIIQPTYFQNHNNKSWHRVTHRFTPNTHNCIYLVYCTACSIQLVGETRMSLTTRLRQHMWDITNNKDLDSPLVHHFLLHGLGAMKVAGLQHNATWTSHQRRTREQLWIHLLGATPIRPT